MKSIPNNAVRVNACIYIWWYFYQLLTHKKLIKCVKGVKTEAEMCLLHTEICCKETAVLMLVLNCKGHQELGMHEHSGLFRVASCDIMSCFGLFRCLWSALHLNISHTAADLKRWISVCRTMFRMAAFTLIQMNWTISRQSHQSLF